MGPSSEPIYIGASIGMLPYGWASSDDLYNTTPARPRPIAVSPSGTDSSGRRRRAGVEVFLQITGLSYLTETNPTGAYHREHQRAWEQAIPSDPALPECQVQFIGLLFVDYGEQWDKRNLLRLSISKKEIDAFRNGTFFSDHAHAEAVLGERMPHPLTPESLVQFVLFLSPFNPLMVLIAIGTSIVISRLTLRISSVYGLFSNLTRQRLSLGGATSFSSLPREKI